MKGETVDNDKDRISKEELVALFGCSSCYWDVPLEIDWRGAITMLECFPNIIKSFHI